MSAPADGLGRAGMTLAGRRPREAECVIREANAFLHVVFPWTRDELDRRLDDRRWALGAGDSAPPPRPRRARHADHLVDDGQRIATASADRAGKAALLLRAPVDGLEVSGVTGESVGGDGGDGAGRVDRARPGGSGNAAADGGGGGAPGPGRDRAAIVRRKTWVE